MLRDDGHVCDQCGLPVTLSREDCERERRDPKRYGVFCGRECAQAYSESMRPKQDNALTFAA